MYVTIMESATYFNCGYFLLGVGVASFIFRRCAMFLFRVAAVYLMGGEIFGRFSTLGSGAVLSAAMAGMIATELSAPLILMKEDSLLVDCHRVRTLVAYFLVVLHLYRRGPPQRLI